MGATAGSTYIQSNYACPYASSCASAASPPWASWARRVFHSHGMVVPSSCGTFVRTEGCATQAVRNHG